MVKWILVSICVALIACCIAGVVYNAVSANVPICAEGVPVDAYVIVDGERYEMCGSDLVTYSIREGTAGPVYEIETNPELFQKLTRSDFSHWEEYTYNQEIEYGYLTGDVWHVLRLRYTGGATPCLPDDCRVNARQVGAVQQWMDEGFIFLVHEGQVYIEPDPYMWDPGGWFDLFWMATYEVVEEIEQVCFLDYAHTYTSGTETYLACGNAMRSYQDSIYRVYSEVYSPVLYDAINKDSILAGRTAYGIEYPFALQRVANEHMLTGLEMQALMDQDGYFLYTKVGDTPAGEELFNVSRFIETERFNLSAPFVITTGNFIR